MEPAVNCIYMLRCIRGNRTVFYVGSTTNLFRRLLEHARHQSRYTRQFEMLYLIGFNECNTIQQARRVEHQAKKWSVAKKEDWAEKFWPEIKLDPAGNFLQITLYNQAEWEIEHGIGSWDSWRRYIGTHGDSPGAYDAWKHSGFITN